jgi:Ca2+:H+ antiporter
MRAVHIFAPAVALAAFLVGILGWPVPVGLLLVALAMAVFSAIHNAEIIAHRLGEPYGTLVLAISITIIEVGLIVSLMLTGAAGKETLARDAIYSALMIICNGVIGICLLVGALRHREQSFTVAGARSALAALIVLSVLSLVLPSFTTSAPGNAYAPQQLAFVAIVSLVLWAGFVAFQTGRHRDYFLPETSVEDEESHAEPPTKLEAWQAFVMLTICLVSVVGLAKVLSPEIEKFVTSIGAPRAIVGVLIALLVLLPETGAAIRAASVNRIQTSMNLALGSAMASIGLTIPAVAIATSITGLNLSLGILAKDAILLGLTFFVSAVTLSTGRTNILLAAVHLVLFASFLFLTLVP